ncbi:hypothetical protein LEP1GSC127_1659 [Leptospira kirschneri str. 200801925]|nr:hypothetical protein LEP1GSC127_1659 [Leptospira kirschneri str. 200801925]
MNSIEQIQNYFLEREANFMTKLEKKRYVFLGVELLFFRFF